MAKEASMAEHLFRYAYVSKEAYMYDKRGLLSTLSGKAGVREYTNAFFFEALSAPAPAARR
jgi:hypothetical protein